MSAEQILERAMRAESQLESCRQRVAELTVRLEGIMGEPDATMRAQTWMDRAKNTERLLAELMRWIEENPSVRELLPTGFPERVRAQLLTVTILHRDEEAMGEQMDEEWIELRTVGDSASVRVRRTRGG